jgi:hypothetical protein
LIHLPSPFLKKNRLLYYFPHFPISSGVDRAAKCRRNDALNSEKPKKYSIDSQNGRLHLGSFSMPFPQSKAGRVSIGAGFIVGGCLGFLPILGFWMVPLGVVILSHDIGAARRFRRKTSVKIARFRRRRGRLTPKDQAK